MSPVVTMSEKSPRMKAWTAQQLIKRAHIIDYLRAHIRISTHPVPEGMIGQLYCVDGITDAADAIMDHLEERAVELEAKHGEE